MHAAPVRPCRPRPGLRMLALLCAAAWLLVGLSARAQTLPAPDTAELARKLEQSLKLIEALNARVSQLEKQLGASPAAQAMAPPDAATDARLQAVEKTVDELAADSGRNPRDNGGIALHGFADTTAVGTRHAKPGQRQGFAVGTLDFYLTPELGDHVKTLVELNFGVDSAGDTDADLERLQIGYTVNDALTLWLGRFHTPIGYWNMAFHHGAEIQTTILRPRMLDFEDDGGFLPVHTTGAWATGAQRFGADRLVYHFFAGNGTRIEGGQLNPNAGGDDSGNKVAGAGLSYRFGGRLDGWTAGLNGLTQKVNAYDGGSVAGRTRLRLLGGYAVYDDDGWEVIGEGYAFRNTDLGNNGNNGSYGNTHGSWSAYAQVGRTLHERWLPYYRFEKASLNAEDPYFAALDSGRFSSRHVLGLRYNADARAAVKLELNRTRQRAPALGSDALRLQYAIGF